MPVKDSNLIAINHVLSDDMDGALQNPENDLNPDPNLFESGPKLPVKIMLNRGQVTIEFPTLFKIDDDREKTETISISVDYFNDMIRIFHNDNDMLTEIPYDDTKQVMLVPYVKKLISESGE